MMHDYAALDWASTIVISTILVRLLVFPVGVLVARNGANGMDGFSKGTVDDGMTSAPLVGFGDEDGDVVGVPSAKTGVEFMRKICSVNSKLIVAVAPEIHDENFEGVSTAASVVGVVGVIVSKDPLK